MNGVVKKCVVIYGFILIAMGADAQGLFEQPEEKLVDIRGFGRGVFFLAEKDGNPGISSLYSEAGLLVEYQPDNRFDLFSEIRFRSGYEYEEYLVQPQIRELYGELHLGRFDLRAGQQVVAWGRADAFNPTDNITPRDYFVRSPEPDDMRIGNYLFRATFRINDFLSLEGIWVPLYRYSVYRYDLFDMPDFVSFYQPDYVTWGSNGGNAAVKLDYFFPAIDGSVSIFNGYDPQAGIGVRNMNLDFVSGLSLSLQPEPFRQTTIGTDFATTAGKYGLRGELGLRIPGKDYEEKIFTPQTDLRYVIGIDRSIGKFNLLVQYSGQWIPGFKPMPDLYMFSDSESLPIPEPFSFYELNKSLDEQIRGFNGLIFGQTHRISHVLMIRPSVSLLFETLKCELFASYNLNTEEYNIDGRLSYKFNDRLGVTIGGQYFDGPDITMYDMIRPVFSGGYMELRYSF
jgi:hypothetical protein